VIGGPPGGFKPGPGWPGEGGVPGTGPDGGIDPAWPKLGSNDQKKAAASKVTAKVCLMIFFLIRLSFSVLYDALWVVSPSTHI
jgi:hypothetical protein